MYLITQSINLTSWMRVTLMPKSITSQLSDEAIYQILEIIASEIDDIDDKELSITFED